LAPLWFADFCSTANFSKPRDVTPLELDRDELDGPLEIEFEELDIEDCIPLFESEVVIVVSAWMLEDVALIDVLATSIADAAS